MTTSDRRVLIENHSRKATDAKPVGTYTRTELIKLEHEWRLKLKAAGFDDYEMWDNNPRKKVKKVKFIKGKIRMYRYQNLEGFFQVGADITAYFRVVGLYAHHCPKGHMPEKYRELLKVYAECGYRNEAIRKVNPKLKSTAVHMYLTRNFKKMLEFVNAMEQEDDTRISPHN